MKPFEAFSERFQSVFRVHLKVFEKYENIERMLLWTVKNALLATLNGIKGKCFVRQGVQFKCLVLNPFGILLVPDY